MRTCLACGVEDRDVAMRLIDVPPAEQRVVQAALVASEDQRGVKGFEYSDVREAFIAEPRCRDRSACAARVRALQPVAPAGSAADEDLLPSWLR
jgi:hypothetical protein